VSAAETRPFRYNGYVAGGFVFDALSVLAPSTPVPHRWYAFPAMAPSEVVAFRTYDTDMVDGWGVDRQTAFFTPHSAFHDPDVPIGHPARFSIELRVMCLFI
jgi:hypothetical protein